MADEERADEHIRTTVLVTGVGGGAVGHQILSALLLLGDKYRLVVADADANAYGLYQVERRYLLPLAAEDDYLEAVLRLVRREEVRILIPGTEPEVNALAGRADVLRDAGCIPLIHQPEVVQLCRNKARLYQWLAERGYDIPQTVGGAGWRELVGTAGFPIVGKPAEATGGSRNVAILKSEAEIAAYLEECRDLRGGVVFQGYVGDRTSEYTVGVLTTLDGALIDSIVVHRRLFGMSLGATRVIDGREYALSTGYSQGCVIRHPLIQETCERLALEIGMRGAANVQCRLDGGRVVILEVHARFSGTSSIRAQAGYNEPDILIRHVLAGESFGRLDYQTDVLAIRAFQSELIPLAEVESVPRA